MPDATEIWEKAGRIARLVITGIYGPCPVPSYGPAGDGPRTGDAGITEQQFYHYFAGVDARREWNRKVAALTKALATEARRIEDRGVAMREMQPARVRRVVTVGQGVAA